ncbi:MAG: hypothetical protein ABIG68_11570 [Acidobacteriota bacterium]
MRDLVRSYYAQIRSLLRERPDLRPYLKRCKHCGILFFTGRSNAGRDDLRCGFGCREAHRRRSSHSRSAAFYREHPEKKRHQNRKRYLQTCPRPGGRAAKTIRDKAALPKHAAPPPIVRHVRVIVSLIERRRVGLAEIVEMLAKKGRQHRIAWWKRRAYGGCRIEGRGS